VNLSDSFFFSKEVNLMKNKINQNLLNKINSLLDNGITSGLRKNPKPGNMCLEQVVSYALGEEITDESSCVGKQVRYFFYLSQ